MRTIVLALAAFTIWLVAPAAAASSERGVDNPRAFVARTYETYRARTDVPPADPSFAYSDRLKALYDAYDDWQRRHQDLVGAVAFDWWTNSQDWGDLEVTELVETRDGPERLTVTVRFVNLDRPEVNRFLFVQQGERWYLDDVVNGDGEGDDGWTLSALLRERPE